MNVMIVSQCSKKALTESRRILDQFAVRHGDRTWLTPITAQGLDALHRLLRSTARRNTAVACHWVRSPGITELMWVVGDASQFGPEGEVPTNTTERKVVRADDENNWHSATPIGLLAAMAALFHDFGKANIWFQGKLKQTAEGHETYRHEWVSLRLFQAFVGESTDTQWLERLAAWGQEASAESLTEWLKGLARDGIGTSTSPPLQRLPPVAKAVGWLVLSHHLLPAKRGSGAQLLDNPLANVSADWGYTRPQGLDEAAQTTRKSKAKVMATEDCWNFGEKEANLPTQSRAWRTRAAKLASRMLACPALFAQAAQGDPPFDAYVLHLSRLSLMLADRHYSSQDADTRLGDASFEAYANTAWDEGGKSFLKQKLDEHLIGVEKAAHGIVRALPSLERSLPGITQHKLFRKRSADKRFQWQDKACDHLGAWVVQANTHGFFGVNMASTGLGKTLGNAKIMAALADPVRGVRFTVALGLRTLTLQTGQALRERLHLNDAQMAVLVGSDAVRQLFELQAREGKAQEKRSAQERDSGSESMQTLLEDDLPEIDYTVYDVQTPLDKWLGTEYRTRGRGAPAGNKSANSAGVSSKARRLLHAPALVCTIDHLMPACESTRGGHQIVPMLRLLSSDLVLDEPDDFGIEDTYALTRLVYFAGLLGSKVLLSSATLPPALVQGLYAAYAAGRAVYQVNRGQAQAPANIVCAWVDENAVHIAAQGSEAGFVQAHQTFVSQRVAYLEGQQKTQGRRKAETIPVSGIRAHYIHQDIAATMFEQAQRLHKLPCNHVVDKASGKTVSIGLMRMANIDPLIDVATQAFRGFGAPNFPEDLHFHLCVYHSRFPLLLRSAIEHRLDQWLQRHQEAKGLPPAFLSAPEFQTLLAQSNAKHHIFVVLATAVAEVGRDHDYDWAVVEPSSMRSFIQLAGRIRRHRPGAVVDTNMVLLNVNCRHLENPNGIAFTRPGFEDAKHRLKSHELSPIENGVLRSDELLAMDARARIEQAPVLEPSRYLVDLEHQRLNELLVDNIGSTTTSVRRFWEQATHLLGSEQKLSMFRSDPLGRETVVLLPHENGEPASFYRIAEDGVMTADSKHVSVLPSLTSHPRVTSWGHGGYEVELERWCQRLGKSDPIECAKRFARVDLPLTGSARGWEYEDTLGIRRRST